MRSTVIWHIRVVMPAQDVGRPVEWMVADPPTTFCVTIHLPHACVDTEAYGADQSGLTKIRAETGPEVVIEIWTAVESPRMKREPMPQGADEADHRTPEPRSRGSGPSPRRPCSRAVRGEGVGVGASDRGLGLWGASVVFCLIFFRSRSP